MQLSLLMLIPNKKLAISFSCLIFGMGSGYSQTYSHYQEIPAEDDYTHMFFLQSLAFDGDFLVVGAPSEDRDSLDIDSIFGAGAAYIYKINAENKWEYIQKINASDRAKEAYFGFSVDIYNDVLIVGALSETKDETGSDSIRDAGALYVFRRDNSGNWKQEKKLVSSDRELSLGFGFTCAIKNETIIVGTPLKKSDTTSMGFNYKGGAYIFESDGNKNWNEVAALEAFDSDAYDYFGYSVDIDGDIAVVGAGYDDKDVSGISAKKNSGSAYIYERNTSGVWLKKQKIKSSDFNEDDNFGVSVAIDSSFLVVGARYQDWDSIGNNRVDSSGAAYVFKYNGSSWVEQQKLVQNDRHYQDFFGYSVAINDGLIAVGSPLYDFDSSESNYKQNAGIVFTFALKNGKWAQKQKLHSPNRKYGFFGNSISIDAKFLLIGSDYNRTYSFINSNFIGIEKLYNSSNNQVYPNPSNGVVYIDFGTKNDDVQLIIYNALGEIVGQSSNHGSNQIQITLPSQKGLYLIELATEDGAEVFKIIRN